MPTCLPSRLCMRSHWIPLYPCQVPWCGRWGRGRITSSFTPTSAPSASSLSFLTLPPISSSPSASPPSVAMVQVMWYISLLCCFWFCRLTMQLDSKITAGSSRGCQNPSFIKIWSAQTFWGNQNLGNKLSVLQFRTITGITVTLVVFLHLAVDYVFIHFNQAVIL